MTTIDSKIAAGLGALGPAGVPPETALAVAKPSKSKSTRTPVVHLGRRIGREVKLGTQASRGIKNPGPRTHHIPTELLRAQVAHFIAMGTSIAKTASLIGIHETTLMRHYRHEIDHAGEIADINVAANLYKVATGDAPQAAPAAQFWLSRRSKAFKEVKAVELTGKDGKPIEVDHRHAVIDARQLSPEQRTVMREIIMQTMQAESDDESNDVEYEEVDGEGPDDETDGGADGGTYDETDDEAGDESGDESGDDGDGQAGPAG